MFPYSYKNRGGSFSISQTSTCVSITVCIGVQAVVAAAPPPDTTLPQLSEN